MGIRETIFFAPGGFILGEGNPKLTSMQVSTLTSIGGSFTVNNNPMLGAVSLPKVVSIGGSFKVNTNPMLGAVSLPKVVSIEADLTFGYENASLAAFDVPSLKTIGGEFQWMNSSKSGSIEKVVLPALTTVGSIYCQAGDVEFSPQDFSAPLLVEVTGTFLCYYPGQNWTDLGNLTKVWGVDEFGNSLILTIPKAGLPSLETVKGGMWVYVPDEIEAVFPKLTHAGYLMLSGGSPKLPQALSYSFPKLKSAGINAHDLEKVKKLHFPELETSGNIAISYNKELEELSFPKLTQLGQMSVTYNEKLKKLWFPAFDCGDQPDSSMGFGGNPSLCWQEICAAFPGKLDLGQFGNFFCPGGVPLQSNRI